MKRLIFFIKTLETKGFISICNRHKCLIHLFLIRLNTYVMGLRPLEIYFLLQCGDRLYTSESDVYRRQILTTKVDPRAVRVNKVTDIWFNIFVTTLAPSSPWGNSRRCVISSL